MANALACAAANASLDLFADGTWAANVARIAAGLATGLAPCGNLAGVVDVRVRGAIGVVEFAGPVDAGALCARFVAAGVWVRPMGRVVYLTPAFTMPDADLDRLTGAVSAVLAA
jgi:adenosylmethionine-8-amino-7-oxononanoate aminotransferase